MRFVSKSEAEAIQLEADLTLELFPARCPIKAYRSGDVAAPVPGNGRLFVAQNTGVSALYPPRWPLTGQVTDGSVVWQAALVGDAALPTIQSAAWAVQGATPSLVVTPSSAVGYTVSALVSGGDAGARYHVGVVVTMSDGRVIRRGWALGIAFD